MVGWTEDFGNVAEVDLAVALNIIVIISSQMKKSYTITFFILNTSGEKNNPRILYHTEIKNVGMC